jgi:hypothetical protein
MANVTFDMAAKCRLNPEWAASEINKLRAERDSLRAELATARERLDAMAEVPCTAQWQTFGLAKSLACTPDDRCSFCRIRALKSAAPKGGG